MFEMNFFGALLMHARISALRARDDNNIGARDKQVLLPSAWTNGKQRCCTWHHDVSVHGAMYRYTD
jgi:hypothetical protein